MAQLSVPIAIPLKCPVLNGCCFLELAVLIGINQDNILLVLCAAKGGLMMVKNGFQQISYKFSTFVFNLPRSVNEPVTPNSSVTGSS